MDIWSIVAGHIDARQLGTQRHHCFSEKGWKTLVLIKSPYYLAKELEADSIFYILIVQQVASQDLVVGFLASVGLATTKFSASGVATSKKTCFPNLPIKLRHCQREYAMADTQPFGLFKNLGEAAAV